MDAGRWTVTRGASHRALAWLALAILLAGCTPLEPPSRIGSVSDRVRLAYFTNAPPRWVPGRTQDADLPPGLREFDPDRETQVVFVLTVNNPGSGISARGVLHRPDGAPVKSIWLTHPNVPAFGWYGFDSTFPMAMLQDHPGEWVLEVSIGDERAGRYTFRVKESPAVAAKRRTPEPAVVATPFVTLEIDGPAGADLAIDGRHAHRFIDNGRFTSSVARAGLDLEISKPGFAPWRETITPTPTQDTIARQVTLSPTAPPPPAPLPIPPGPDTRAPVVVIESPVPNATVASGEVEIVAVVRDDVGVARVQVMVNGIEVARARHMGLTGREHRVQEMVRLEPGHNLIRVVAVDEAGNTAEATRAVTRMPAAAGASPPPRPRETPTTPVPVRPSRFYADSWAVVIGINDYQHPRVPKLRYAVNDARAVERTLLTLGFRQDRIVTLLDAEATKTRIESVLGDDLHQRVGPDDRVLVFFAGHGKTDRLRSGEEEGYLLPVDVDPHGLFATAVSMTSLRQISDRLPAKHILYVMDACYSGYAIFNRAIADDLLEEMIRKPAIQILTAGRQGDEAQERGGHGVFTDVLLRGLAGDAFGGKAWLALEELGVWVKQRVYVESNRRQVPQYGSVSGEGQFVFTRPGASAP